MGSVGSSGSLGFMCSSEPAVPAPTPAPLPAPAPKLPKTKKAQIDLEGVHELKADDVSVTVQLWQAIGVVVVVCLALPRIQVILSNI